MVLTIFLKDIVVIFISSCLVYFLLVFIDVSNNSLRLSNPTLSFFVLSCYLVLYPFQTLIAVVRSKKKLGLKNLKGYKRGILLSPLLMILNAISITVGVLGNAGWKSVSRNSEKSDQK